MNTIPELNEIKRIAADGDFKVIPVSCEILSDFTTPIEVLRILKKASNHVYMLESARTDDTWGRYTFLGFDPKLLITCKDGRIDIGGKVRETAHPADEIREVLAAHKSPRIEGLPSFTGGLVGYFSFEYLGYSEPTVRCELDDEDEFMDLDLMLFDKVIAFDNMKQKIVLIVNIDVDDIDNNYKKALIELKELAALLREGEKEIDPGGVLTGDITPLFDKARFCSMVEKGKEYIREGDIFQIVLSNRLSAPFEGSLLNTYRFLRTINPSPYMFYFSGTDVEVAGASPETLVKLQDGVLHTFPLAGTRKRGANEEEDLRLEKELLADEKELAEHNMLVDLGRNDLGRISRFG
ncbi:MAG: chorismate-binding protein, partial [Lachnospiraceae bacterium]|nr:chorismate-binding protein [Lachnospiraceae bacterium]